MPNRKKYYLKTPAKILIAAAVLALAAAVFYALRARVIIDRIIGKTYSGKDFGIEDYVSAVDRDGDGTDDQTDILQGARKYVATKPKYESRYYSGGYPDDGYGVCTDVVAQAMKNAGYDLMELVNADIEKDPSDYGGDIGDKNIDFRRVRNLVVYFRHTAKELTTDVKDIAEWQGGDIVVFEGHIGVISDKRNADGVTYVIHHGSEEQTSYEQDILEGRDDIIGHFRIS